MSNRYYIISLSICLIFIVRTNVFAQKSRLKEDAKIEFSTSDFKEIPLGLSGVSMEISNTDPFRYDNQDFTNKLKEANVGWLRFFGGTSNNYYDWRLGEITEEFNSQLIQDHQYMCYIGMQTIKGIGGVWFKDYLEMVKKLGAKVILTVNSFTDSPESIADLARYVKNHNIQVEYWQLSNEPWSYLTHDKIPLFTGSADYLDKVKVYHDSIVSVIPEAKTSVFTSVFVSKPHKNWREEIKNYHNKYWSSITFHDYSGGNGDNKNEAMKSTNSVLKTLVDRLDDRAGELLHGDGAVISTEWNSRFGGKYTNRTALYGAIYDAEFLMRLVGNDKYKVEYLGLYNSIFDLVNYKVKYQYDAVSAAELGEVFNTSDKSVADFQVYHTIAGLALTLTNKAINSSNKVYSTEVISNLKVLDANNDSIPAIFGQVYQGVDGKIRTLVTNKSDRTITLSLEENKNQVSKRVKHYSLSSTDYAHRNTGWVRDIGIKEKDVKGNIEINGYSVNLIEWNSEIGISEISPPTFIGRPIHYIAKNKIEVDWKEEKSISDYEVGVLARENGSYNENNINWTTAKGNSIVLDKLQENQHYKIRVRAAKGNLKSDYSRPLYVSTFVPEPTHFDLVNVKRSGLQLKWRFAENALGYKVKLFDENKVEIRTLDVKENLGCEIMNLLSNKKYYVAISSYNYYGESAISELKSIYIDNNVPLAPHNVIAMEKDGNVNLSWIPSWVHSGFESFEYGSNDWRELTKNWKLSKDMKSVINSTSYVSAQEDESVSIYEPHYEENTYVNLWFKINSNTGKLAVYSRYIDQHNYYALELDNIKNEIEIIKVANNEKSILSKHKISRISNDRYYLLSFSIRDSTISYFLDRVLGVTNINDLTPIAGKGRVGIYTNNQEAYFDKIDIKKSFDEKYNIFASKNVSEGFEPLAKRVSNTFFNFQNDLGYKYFRIESQLLDKVSNNKSFVATLQLTH